MADTQAPSPLAAEASAVSAGAATPTDDDIAISGYTGEVQLQSIMDMVSVSLSEPYSVFTYRFFLHGWPQYCLLAHSGDKLVGLILCKAEKSKRERMRGYIAMLAVDPAYRKRGLGSKLVVAAVQRMAEACDEVSGRAVQMPPLACRCTR